MAKTPQLLTLDQIRSAQTVITEDVHVPEWGGTVRVKALTAKERDAFEAGLVVGKGKNRRVSIDNVRAQLVVASVVDADGKQMFKPADAEWMGDQSAAAVARVYDVAGRLSGVSDDDVEELAGNSSDQSDGSSSG